MTDGQAGLCVECAISPLQSCFALQLGRVDQVVLTMKEMYR